MKWLLLPAVLALTATATGCYDGAFEGARSESNRVQERIENDPLTQRIRSSGPQRPGTDAGAPATPTDPQTPPPPPADAGKPTEIEI